MKTTLALLGSGEFTPSMNETDRQLIQRASNTFQTPVPSLVILPTAAGQEPDYYKWIEKGAAHFNQFKINVFGIPAITRDDMHRDSLLNQLKTAHIIYFSGGDPGYLFNTLQKTPILDLILTMYRQGVILAGSSAGAMIMGQYVLSNPREMAEEGQSAVWKPALRLVNYAVMPHYDWVLKMIPDFANKALATIPQDSESRFIGIDEDTSLLIDQDNNGFVLGKGKVVIKNKLQSTTLSSMQQFTL